MVRGLAPRHSDQAEDKVERPGKGEQGAQHVGVPEEDRGSLRTAGGAFCLALQAPSPGAGDSDTVCSQLRPSRELSRLFAEEMGHGQCLVAVGTQRPGPLASLWDNSAGQSKPQASLMGWSLHLQV